MALLEKRIPPLALTLVAGVAIWALSAAVPGMDLPGWFRLPVSLFLLFVGIAFCVAGVVEFRRVQTTVDPRKPESSSSLVCSGIYSVTRNPMYVGFTLVLLALTVFLASPWLLLIVLAFVLYLDHYQIRPEERALANLFGPEFKAYQSRVRRWL
ncbi:isoprenylcysteine carboxylmethyltransferase family protein [Marinobacter sp. M216]|uniref:Isoprenylcysteine carboxylmethyltransferase family protein n=1 Tax=Marinobacter albus TaxID=3030833 RepID=A0ABT7HD00_9GAMM|nr:MULTISPECIES: isoprenylcysteine carboxylmethyltransferase family protein [unclassified Marinobacter]MBW7469504.1 isoprenylcysteine carboxylmethyltransferase family protein [Marinobacter sp. F4218]MDK9558227.1 isoprenylcysteine carboxylmethyltransferase family protein [Marinobacter sp. M216]